MYRIAWHCTYLLPILNLILLVACIPVQGVADIDPTLDCTQVVKPQEQPDALAIYLAAPYYRAFCWRLYGPILAASHVKEPAIRIVAQPYNMGGWQPRIEQALRSGTATDLMHFSENSLPTFAAAGYLTPLDHCRRQYAEFAEILEPTWQAVTWQQHIWGIPYEIALTHLYFNKGQLQALDWSPEEIAALPQRIGEGKFTLEDLVQVAETAITRGIVAPGFGYWPHIDDPWTLQLTYVAYGGRLVTEDQKKLVITKEALTHAFTFHKELVQRGIMHPSLIEPRRTFLDKTMWEDAVAHGRVLFWVGRNYNWPKLTVEYRDDFIGANNTFIAPGYSLYPSGAVNRPGVALMTGIGIYVVPSVQATGRQNQPAVCALLAKVLTPEINALNSALSGYMSVLRTQATHPAFQPYPFSQAQLAIWRHSHTLPYRHPSHSAYTVILNEMLTAVQLDKLTPSAATEQAISKLRSQMGDMIFVE